jgi:hypothetical protein
MLNDPPEMWSPICQIARKKVKALVSLAELSSHITQSIFRPASWRERLGEHAKGDRRDGGLKMGWTKPLRRGPVYGY